jgi:hypothetical protein
VLSTGLPSNNVALWVAYFVVCVVVAICPVIVSRISSRHYIHHSVTPPVASPEPEKPAVQDAIDAGNALLASLIDNLERRAETAEANWTACLREIAALKEQLATANARIDYLQERLMRGGDRGDS